MPRGTIARTVVASTPDNVIRKLALSEIEIDPGVNVRSGAEAADEAVRIDALARAIFEQGQLQPVLVRPNGNGKYKLIAGHRRLKAIALIGEKTNETWPVEAIITDKTDEAAWDAAFSENYNRRNFSPIELAENIMTLRERKGWSEGDWTKNVAEYLSVSRATVTQHVKLLNLSPAMREKVHTGYISAQSAFELLAAEEAAREIGAEIPSAEQILERAEEKAKKEREETAKKNFKAGKSAKAAPPAKGKASQPAGKQAPKVEHKHVVAAVRETEAPVAKPRSRTEIISFFADLQGPTLPDVMARFVAAFVEKWAKGSMGDKALMARWDAMSNLIDVAVAKPKAKAAAK